MTMAKGIAPFELKPGTKLRRKNHERPIEELTKVDFSKRMFSANDEWSYLTRSSAGEFVLEGKSGRVVSVDAYGRGKSNLLVTNTAPALRTQTRRPPPEIGELVFVRKGPHIFGVGTVISVDNDEFNVRLSGGSTIIKASARHVRNRAAVEDAIAVLQNALRQM